jgi:hypothetical protein
MLNRNAFNFGNYKVLANILAVKSKLKGANTRTVKVSVKVIWFHP